MKLLISSRYSLFPLLVRVPFLGQRSLSWCAFPLLVSIPSLGQHSLAPDGDAGSDRLRLTPTRGRTAIPYSLTSARSLIIYLLMACILLVSCQNLNQPSGKMTRVERVVSGQIIEIADRSAAVPVLEPIRLIGIQAPDIRQKPWGQEARIQLEKLTLGQEVSLEFDVQEKDRFNRLLAYVWLEGKLINEYMVKEGLALAEPDFPNTKYMERLINAQERARLMGLGIWNPGQPMRQTPAQFRRQIGNRE